MGKLIVKLNYKLSKCDASSPWLILIHGLFGNADNLAGIKRHFESSFNIVSVDLPDHGESPWTNGFLVSDAADAIYDIMQSLNIEKSAVISNHIITGLPILKFIRKAGTNIKFSTNEQNHVLATKNFGILGKISGLFKFLPRDLIS